MVECIRCHELIDGDYETCAACSFETEAGPPVFGVKVRGSWLSSWDAKNRLGTFDGRIHRFADWRDAMNAAHYLGGKAVALDAVAAPSLFE